jgi:Tfp pilus assembly protein PilE
MNKKSGLTIVEASIVLAILLLLAAISLPALFQNQQKKRAAECAMNLDAVMIACKRQATETGGFPKSLSDLVPTYFESIPACPSGGTYTLGTPEGDPPTCSVPGHHL